MYLITLDPTMIENLETVLRKTALFASFTEDEIQALGAKVIKEQLQRGEPLFRERDPCKGLYIVVSGNIQTVCGSTQSGTDDDARTWFRRRGNQHSGHVSPATSHACNQPLIARCHNR